MRPDAERPPAVGTGGRSEIGRAGVDPHSEYRSVLAERKQRAIAAIAALRQQLKDGHA